ncbi:efflux transporter outer membrane subunit [Cupriavidus pauculus]|uniref:RND transporter n=1 Tax=Cupriavidus pauculus TaxID=82633 RepID=A0A2N5C2I9_9BURK|nr:efflux transporter outer membrane subunit [Cupriavidus pauculus]PLP96442.1 RND transporter [Cupriavidus pauculus]
MKFLRLISALAAGGVLLAACATPERVTPTTLPLADNYVNESLAQAGAVPELANWWESFNDPVMNQLVDTAQSSNLDLKMAVSRIDTARAIRLGASSAGLPQVDLSASAGRQRQTASQASSGVANVNNNFEVGLGASWEVDLFGRIRQNVAAADAEVLSSSEMANAVRLAITGEVVQTYLSARSLEHRLSLVGENARSQAETARLTKQLFDAGAVPIADVDRAQAQAQATLAVLPVLELERQNALHRLSILTASSPQDVYTQMDALAAMPHWIAPEGVGTPADLLRQRPDVRAAEAAAVAAYARVGVARAELLPHLQLAGFIGAAADGLSGAGLARSLAWAFGAGATAPVFDGGRRRSNVLLRQAEAEQALLRYRSTVLVAVNEVEGAIVATARNRDRVARLRKSAASARSAYEQINQSWRAGESAFIDTLQVQRSLLEAEDALSIAEVQELRSQVSLVTALGR